jgi:RimJ/RimL family protein N-acetyltransferase
MIKINDKIHCRFLSINDAKELYDVVNFSRNHLTNLVWVKSATLESTEQFLKIKSDYNSADELYGIFYEKRLIGTIEFRGTNDIGYWLRHDYRNKGIMSIVTKMMTEIKGTHVELLAKIKHQNEYSRKILTNAGFRFIGEDKDFLYLKRPISKELKQQTTTN